MPFCSEPCTLWPQEEPAWSQLPAPVSGAATPSRRGLCCGRTAGTGEWGGHLGGHLLKEHWAKPSLWLIPGRCVLSTCQEGQWRCGGDGGHCEELVPGCAEGEALCQENGHCVPHGWLCDNQDDCGDGSDEEGECLCSCVEATGLVSPRTCNRVSWGQGSCPGVASLAAAPIARDYLWLGGMKGRDGVPVPLGFRASLGPYSSVLSLPACPVLGCATPGCGEGQMTCSSGHCLPLALLCDGQDDCGDGTDEQGCPCPQGLLACADGRCLPPALLCDGHPDCPDAADEKSCLGELSPPWKPAYWALPPARPIPSRAPTSPPHSFARFLL